MTEEHTHQDELGPITEPLWRHPLFRWMLTLFAMLASSAMFWWKSLEVVAAAALLVVSGFSLALTGVTWF